MAGFIQIIELKTTRADEIRALVDEARDERGLGKALRGTVTQDRDRPGYYLNVVEFESYEVAMDNSDDPEVSDFAARLAALCDEPPRYYNLDVVEAWSSATSPSTKAALAGAAAAVAGVAAAGVGKARERLNERRSAAPGRTTRPSTYRQPARSTHVAGTGTSTSGTTLGDTSGTTAGAASDGALSDDSAADTSLRDRTGEDSSGQDSFGSAGSHTGGTGDHGSLEGGTGPLRPA